MRKFDLIVISSGSDLKVPENVFNAGQYGEIIERGPFRNTWVNHGCIPSKIPIH